jgi:hypothetical protein
MMRALKILSGAAVLAMCLAPAAHADEWNKRTYLTFSGPVQIPGATLAAGTYTFELADPNMARHVIRVSEKDSGKPVALFMTIPQDRLDPPDNNLVLFRERPAGAPQAIQAWFYPGDRIGEEFVYPKSQAVQIAKANRTAVLATNDEAKSNASESDRMSAMRSAEVGRVDENGAMKAETPKAAAPPAPAPAPTEQSQVGTSGTAANRPSSSNTMAQNRPSTSAAQANSQPTRRHLPRTASNLVAIELLSACALAGSLTARALRRRRARVS